MRLFVSRLYSLKNTVIIYWLYPCETFDVANFEKVLPMKIIGLCF